MSQVNLYAEAKRQEEVRRRLDEEEDRRIAQTPCSKCGVSGKHVYIFSRGGPVPDAKVTERWLGSGRITATGPTPPLVFCDDCADAIGWDEYDAIDTLKVIEWMKEKYGVESA